MWIKTKTIKARKQIHLNQLRTITLCYFLESLASFLKRNNCDSIFTFSKEESALSKKFNNLDN